MTIGGAGRAGGSTALLSADAARPTDDLASRVAHLRAEVTALVALEPAVDGATGPALHAELRTAAGQLHAFAARILARVEADGRWSAGGSRTFPDWVARRQLTSTGAVRREVVLGRALDEILPRTATAVAKGDVTFEHAEVLAHVAATSDARRAALASSQPDRNEAALLERARHMPLDSYRREVDRWATQVDAAAAESEHEAACAKEYLTLSRRRDGVAVQGFLTIENAEILATALRSVAGVPSRGDVRSREERQAAALVDAGRLLLDRGLIGGGQLVRPHLLVHVTAETLRGIEGDESSEADRRDGAVAAVGADGTHGADSAVGADRANGRGLRSEADLRSGRLDASRFDGLPPATLSNGSPLPPSTLARLVCDGELTRVVFSANGAVLDVGRAQRTYSGQQRLAVIARDQSCRYPGCGAPPTLGEVHHVTSWASGGPTSVSNGVLLCWFHHGLVHRRGIHIRRIDGGWEFRRDDGALVDDGRAGPSRPGGAETATDPPGWPPRSESPRRSGARPSTWGGPSRAPGAAPPRSRPGTGSLPRERGADLLQDALDLPG